MKTFAEAEAALAASLPNYEARPHQQAFAASVEDALTTHSHLLAEAGCGTGKSLGYLIPAILSGQRVIVATATKALQDQIVEKDLPFLHEHLGVDFTFALLKGRSNYVCRANLMKSTEQGVAEILRRADDEDFDGQRDSLGFDVEHKTWRSVVTTSEECPGKKQCPFGTQCFAEEAKESAKRANIVVVNHSLLFTDLMVREMTGGKASMLGEYDAIIFDEGHEAENFATSVFGWSFHENMILQLTTEVSNFARRMGDYPELLGSIDRLLGAQAAFWASLPEKGRINRDYVRQNKDVFLAVGHALKDIEEQVRAMSMTGKDDSDVARKNVLEGRAASVAGHFIDATMAADDQLVRWVETEEYGRRGATRKAMKTAPVNVGSILRPLLFAAEDEEGRPASPTCIVVSATLSVAGSFEYIAGRLGIDHFHSIDVGSPFDFAEQSILYVPENIPEPKRGQTEEWQTVAIATMGELVRASDGRALLLFTSFADMNAAWNALASRIPHTTMKQGDEPNKVLAERFMADPSSVLFATRSFFTGVDFQGEACSLVVMSKLPFPIFGDPVNEARCELIRAEGGNDFMDYTVPEMTLVLKQGHGRLIRHRDDRGVVAILDPRIRTKPYGRKILASLPESTLTGDLSDVEAFLHV